MNSVADDIFGRGWAFPPGFSVSKGVEMVSGYDDIRQGMEILFSTQPGERVMRPTFGCNLLPMVFENISDELISELKTSITDSILRHEPRADLESVAVAASEQAPEHLIVHCVYRPRGHETTERLVGAIDLNSGNRLETL